MSGLFGLALQQILPRLLTSRVPLKTFVEQVPFFCQRLQADADALVSTACGSGGKGKPGSTSVVRANSPADMAETVQERVTTAEREALEHTQTLFGEEAGRGCRYCHEVKDADGADLWKIEKTRIPPASASK